MPRSVFTKMQILLRSCQETPGLSEDDLVARILDQKPEAFQVFRKQGATIAIDYCRSSTIRRTLHLLRDLRLVTVGGGCRLTQRGRSALANYQGVLGQSVVDYLHNTHGLAFDELTAAMRRLKGRRHEDVVPSPDSIYRELLEKRAFKVPIPEERFLTLLNLLARCDRIVAFVRKYYWPK